MRELMEILKLAQKVLSCPICHRRYQLKEIELKGLLGNICVLQVNCFNHQYPVMMSVVINQQPVSSKSIRNKNNSDNNYSKETARKIDSQEINQLNNQLESFDGDFEKLWKK